MLAFLVHDLSLSLRRESLLLPHPCTSLLQDSTRGHLVITSSGLHYAVVPLYVLLLFFFAKKFAAEKYDYAST